MRQRYWILNPKASAIVASLRAEPQRWAVDEWPAFKLVAHDGAGTELLQVWIANGWWFVSIYRPTSEKLGLVGRTLVWLEYRRWLRSENARSQTGDFNHSRNQAAIDALRVS